MWFIGLRASRRGAAAFIVALIAPIVASILVPSLPGRWQFAVAYGLALIMIMVIVWLVNVPTLLGRALKGVSSQAFLEYELKDGRLCKQCTPNVSMRIATFHLLLGKIVDGADATRAAALLRTLGTSVGKSFALRDFIPKLRRQGASDAGDVGQRLEMWRFFDETAGMGQFDIDSLHLPSVTGTITLRNSFLVFDREPSDQRPYCSFLEGYIESVLETLSDRRLKVEHVHCGMSDPDSTCLFSVATRRNDA